MRVDEAADAAGWDLPVVITLGIAGDFEGEALVELVKRAWAKREADPNEDLHVLEGDREIWCVIDGWEVATILYPEER